MLIGACNPIAVPVPPLQGVVRGGDLRLPTQAWVRWQDCLRHRRAGTPRDAPGCWDDHTWGARLWVTCGD